MDASTVIPTITRMFRYELAARYTQIEGTAHEG